MDTLKENEIRPDYLIKGQAECVIADMRWLLRHRDHFVSVRCPACGSEHRRRYFEKHEMTYVVCLDCESMYVNPRPSPAILKTFYARSKNYAYWNQYIFPASEEARREKIFRPRAERMAEICLRHNIPTNVLLEVGAGFGTFCEEVNRMRIFRRVIAVEPTRDLAETCRRKGLEVVEKSIEQVHLEEDSVDVVVSFEVLEHLFSPRDLLLSCASILSPGGLLIVTCPNVKGFDLVVLEGVSGTIDHEHLNYFHPASLTLLAANCGFETLEVLTPGKLDAELVRKRIIAGEIDISRQPFLKEVLIEKWERVGSNFQQFLADNLLSSHMWLIARKR